MFSCQENNTSVVCTQHRIPLHLTWPDQVCYIRPIALRYLPYRGIVIISHLEGKRGGPQAKGSNSY